MDTRQKQTLGFSMAALLALAGFVAQGCGGDDDDDDTTVIPGGGSGNTGATGGSTTGGTGEGGDGEGGTGNSSTGGTGNTGTGATGGVTNPGECFDEPETAEGDVQFLNRCSTSRCSPFDNERIPGFDGSLPEL